MNEVRRPQTRSSAGVGHGADVTALPKALDESLLNSRELAHLRKDWELGRWETLASVDIHAYQDEQTFQSAALLVAVANQQLGNNDRVRECVTHALSAGASRAVAIAVLASGVHNQLGRARALVGDHEAADVQYHRAVEVGTDAGRHDFAAAARACEQAVQIGLDGDGKRQLPTTVQSECDAGQDIDAESIKVYANAPRILVEREAHPFVLLDSKSLPRSGLHYLVSVLQTRLGDRFSFCEWYQDPACCRSQPCRLTGFLDQQYEARGPSVRLVKSHDFDLSDRVLPPSYSLRRLVLKRDPLYILTSWFALDQLSAHRACLESAGIRMEKIWWQHEPAVLSMAYRILDDKFSPPSSSDLDAWLNSKTAYIRGFRRRWIEGNDATNSAYSYIVDYVELSDFIDQFLEELSRCAETGTTNFEPRATSALQQERFQARRDPFSTASTALTRYIRGEADRFRSYAARVP